MINYFNFNIWYVIHWDFSSCSKLSEHRTCHKCVSVKQVSFDTFWEKTKNKIKYSTSFPSDSSTFINLLAQHQRRGPAAADDWVCLCMVSTIMFATKASVVIWTHNSYSYSGSRKDPLLSKMIPPPLNNSFATFMFLFDEMGINAHVLRPEWDMSPVSPLIFTPLHKWLISSAKEVVMSLPIMPIFMKVEVKHRQRRSPLNFVMYF